MSDVLTSHSDFKHKKHPEVAAPAHSQDASAGLDAVPVKDIPKTDDAPVLSDGQSIPSDEELSNEHAGQDQGEGEEDDDADELPSSFFEEAIDQAELDPWYNDETNEGFDIKEALQLREELRRIGARRFVDTHLNSGASDVRKLVTAFGVRPDLPVPDSWYLRILGLSIERELRRRQKLSKYNTVDDVVQLLRDSKNIVVITGAGISTSLGIPDFRSKNTGFYSKLLARGYDSPEEIFDIHNFDDDPSVFYSLAKEILPVTDRCSPTHAFIKLLQDKTKLLTNYTQNIDNIEAFTGISTEKLIQCHGSWATATCRKCKAKRPGEEIFDHIKAQTVARCEDCIIRMDIEKSRKRKRITTDDRKSRKRGDLSDDENDPDGQYDIPEAGVMKPDITFFGEQLPNKFFERLTEQDRDKVDLVIVIGTSMKVAPVSEIPNYIDNAIPQIYISREPAKHINFDVTLLGQCDDVVAELCRRAGWTIEHPLASDKPQLTVTRSEEEEHHWRISPLEAGPSA